MNKKGFTIVELLAVIVIVSIVGMLALIGYTSYLDHARQKAYDVMARSASNAASEYAMDYLGVKSVTFEKLYEEDYLEYPQDPSDSGKMCRGRVDIIEESEVKPVSDDENTNTTNNDDGENIDDENTDGENTDGENNDDENTPSNNEPSETTETEPTKKKGLRSLDIYEYDVTVCCANYSYKYHFPGGKKVKATNACKEE